MNPDFFVIIICIVSIIFGAFIGIKLFKNYNRKNNKKLEENAREVIAGRKENKIIIDGQEYDATKFRVRDNDNNEKLIDLKGGEIIKDGRREEGSTRVEEIPEQEVKTSGETSNSIGKKKRFARIRSILSRTRRFG